jgi:hypothetical protein
MAARFFDVPQRGDERDAMLAGFRSGLRTLIDPATGLPFDEETIARATQLGSRWWSEFDAVELALLTVHAKAQGLADQIRPRRATTAVLRGVHAPLRGVEPLKASGAALQCEARSGVGSTFVGSTTVPDPAAAFAVNSAGLKFQVLFSVTTPANGLAGSDPAAPLYLVGIDTGERTNLSAGTRLTWAGNAPINAEKSFDVIADGSGGLDDETDAELADRIESEVAHPPASGNSAHTRRWAREASAAVEDAFVYACAKHAGTDVVAVTQKRGRQKETAPKGPLARIPSASTLATVRAYLSPPGSPVKPERVVSFVLGPTPEYVDLALGLALPRGRGFGWSDVRPWPEYAGDAATIAAVADQTHFTLATSAAAHTGAVPRLMVWARSRSRWEELRTTSITPAGLGLFAVVLSSAPAHTLAVNDAVSPLVRGALPLAQGVERYFDSLGPGEVVNLATDPRAPRARRFVDPVERYPQRAGSAILTALQGAIPGLISSGELLAISQSTPTLPTDPASGPRLLVAGHVSVYPSD